ncbi:hypothetical protein V500_03692, partial [Pseudogymnoascus sp. VKM F-4518 (FW-2643)]
HGWRLQTSTTLVAGNFHCEACRLTCALELHQIDNADHPNSEMDLTERKRKGFWQLVQTDYCFRLYFGRPAMITNIKFKVKLPSLELGPSIVWYTIGCVIPDASFVVSSRIAVIVMEFFDFLEGHPERGSNGVDWKIESLCDQIESLLVDWKIEEVLENDTHPGPGKWMLADLLLNGYMSIILMRRKWYRDWDDASITERSLHVSRKFLKAFILLSEAQTKVGFMTINFAGAYRFMALFTLFSSLLNCYKPYRVHDTVSASEDLLMMTRVCSASKNPTVMKKGPWPMEAIETLLKALQHIIARNLESPCYVLRLTKSTVLRRALSL